MICSQREYPISYIIFIVAFPVSSCSLNQFKNWNTLAFGVLSKLV